MTTSNDHNDPVENSGTDSRPPAWREWVRRLDPTPRLLMRLRSLRDVRASTVRAWLGDRAPNVAPTSATLIGAIVLTLLLRLIHSPLSPLPEVGTLLFFPGAALLAVAGIRPAHSSTRVVLVVCMSMTTVMVVGFLASILLPLVGVARPLNTTPQWLVWTVVFLSLLASSAHRGRDPLKWILSPIRPPRLYGLLVSAMLVAVAILGAAQVNRSGNIAVATVGTALDVLTLVGCVGLGWRRGDARPLTTLLYASCLSLLLSQSLRGGHLYGWDIQQEFGVAWNTLHAGVWTVPANHDPYASMLSLTVLPATLHAIAGLHLLAFFELVVPGILALLPVAVFSTVRSVPRWVTSGRSAPNSGLAFAIVVGLVISSVAFSSVLISIARQAMATTLLASLVMVVLDRSIPPRSALWISSTLVVSMSFTHYTTSYLTAAILVGSWVVGTVWIRGWFRTSRAEGREHTRAVRSRRLVSTSLVVVSVVAAFGWNLVITRNAALSAPAGAVAIKGIGIGGSTSSVYLSPTDFERLLVSEYRITAPYIVPFADAKRVPLVSASLPSTPGVWPSAQSAWKEVYFLAVEGLWIVLGLSLAYGIVRLGMRRSYEYSSDLIGLGVTGLLMGALLRSSGTLASFYSPERAAIVTALLLATPTTLFLDDIATGRAHARPPKGGRSSRLTRRVSALYALLLLFGASGLASLIVGGQAPGSLSANDENVADFTVSAAEFETATWLRTHVPSTGIVQSDLYGHLVLLSQPGSYDLVPEILPREVAPGAYVYLSELNLAGGVSQANAGGGVYATMYRTTTHFFERHFSVVFSTGSTRVYH